MPFPVEEKYIAETESNLGVRFPASFRSKMLQDNGGEFETEHDEWILYPFFDCSDKRRLKRTCNDIVHETKIAGEWQAFPKDAIAIASNGEGDQLVFMRSSEDPSVLENSVYRWDHETGLLTSVADEFSQLAGTF